MRYVEIMRKSSRGFPALCLAGAVAMAVLWVIPHAVASTEKDRALGALDKLPLYFVKNDGQLDQKAEFYLKGPTSSIYFTRDGLVFDLQRKETGAARGAKKENRAPCGAGKAQRLVFRLAFEGRNKGAKIEATDPQEARINYLIGKDPAKWKTNVPTFGSLVYRGAWPGVDVVLMGSEGRLKYEFHLAPGVDPRKIQLAYEGIDGLKVSDAGDLVIGTPLGEMRDEKPYVYQEVDGKRIPVGARFKVLGKSTYAFDLDSIDNALPLVIDPTLAYSTYLGGSRGEWGNGIAVDASGNAYVTGQTWSTDLPTRNAYRGTFAGGLYDAFVTKLSASGSSLVYSTYLGGSDDDEGRGIAVDASGNAYVTGWTRSTNFPMNNAHQGTHAGGWDAFVTKLSSSGSSLAYSTYLGGSSDDGGEGIAVDASGNAYVTGPTSSTNFPTQNAFQGTFGGGAYTSDAFVTKLSSSGLSLAYSTYLGGGDDDYGSGIAVDSFGDAYVAGATSSADFPTWNAYQGTYAGGFGWGDAFVTRLGPFGMDLNYSTYLGGSSDDMGNGIAVDASGNAYVTGQTASTNFPTKNAYQGTFAGGRDVFVAKLTWPPETGSYLAYSTYLGGSDDDEGREIAVDASGNAYVTGQTDSTDFPTLNAYQGTFAGGSYDAFATNLSSSGSSLNYSTYLGGNGEDTGYGIAVDSSGNAYVTGYTSSTTDFPTRNAYQGAFGGGYNDAFVTKLLPVEGQCFLLTLSHTGQGGDPMATPASSDGCPVREYVASSVVNLTATPAAQWRVKSWTGTDNDASSLKTNTVTIPASAHATAVNYATGCGSVVLVNENGSWSEMGGCIPLISVLGIAFALRVKKATRGKNR